MSRTSVAGVRRSSRNTSRKGVLTSSKPFTDLFNMPLIPAPWCSVSLQSPWGLPPPSYGSRDEECGSCHGCRSVCCMGETDFASLPPHREGRRRRKVFRRLIARGCGCGRGSAAWVPFPGPGATRAVQKAWPAASCSLAQSPVLCLCLHHEKVLPDPSPAAMLVYFDGGERWTLVW